MAGNRLTSLQDETRRLRIIAIVPVAWLVFTIVIPNFVLGILGRRIVWIDESFVAIWVLLTGGSIAYLLLRVRKVRWLVSTAILGTGVLLISIVVRIERVYEVLGGPWSDSVSHVLRLSEIALNGLGLAAFWFAFMSAMIELLAARRAMSEDRARLADEAARRKYAEDEYKTVFQTAMDGFWVVDSEGRFLDVNDAYCAFSGYTRDELLGMGIADVEANESPEEVATHVRRVQAQLGDRFETRHRRKDGTLFDVEVSARHLATSGGRQYVFLHDITERKRAHQAIEESEAKYRDLVESANTVIVRLDADARITFFNEFAERLFGLAKERALGSHAQGTIFPESAAIDHDLAQMFALAQGAGAHPLEVEFERAAADGSRIWIAWTVTPVYGADGRVRELFCVGNDATERVLANRVIAEQQVRMAQVARLSSLGIMAGGVGHEINNPLAIISIACQQLAPMLRNEHADRATMLRLADTIERHVERISRIVRALKMLSREAASDPFATVDVRSLIDDTLELCRTRMAAHRIDLQLPDIPEGLEIEGRPAQLSQALLNLFMNAYDAVEGQPVKWIRLEIEDQGDSITLAVTDSGLGIPADLQDKIMVPFFTTKGPGRGTGLGLSLTIRIMEAHHGTVTLDRDSINTRFVLRLPKRQPPVNSYASS